MEILELILSGIRILIYWVSGLIYELIVWLYDIFMKLCNSRLLDVEILKIIAERIGVVLGLVMLFIVIFSAIQIMLEPDNLSNKEKGIGNIIKKVILVIVMLGVSQSVFSALYGLQSIIVESNIIGKILIPYEVKTENFGGVLSKELFTTFYYFNEDKIGKDISTMTAEELECYTYMENLKFDIIANNNFEKGLKCLNTKTQITNDDGTTEETYIMQFHALLLPIVGAGAVYFLFSYCLSIGMRTIQLAFLEILSPMAIVAYLSPKKETMFQKWWKIYSSTYIDVFIRIAIISLAVFLIAIIFDSNMNLVFLNSIKGNNNFLINIIMIMAILMFAKKAPELINELIPKPASKLSKGLISPKKMFDDMLGSKQIKSLANNTVGLLGRKTIAGFDAARHGQKFMDGFNTPKGKFGSWLDKQRETYMPNYNDVYKKRREGSKEVEQMNTKWNKGVEIAEKLKKAGAGVSGSGTNAWDKVLNGDARTNLKYYRAIFKDERFIRSKLQVDYNSSIEDDLRRLQQRVNLEGATSTFRSGPITIDGVRYDATNVDKLVENLEKQQKKVEGLKANHASISKQCNTDAQTEEYFKYIKNNDSNPTNPTETKATRGI